MTIRTLDPAALSRVDTDSTWFINLFNSTLLDTEIERELASFSEMDYARILSSCWMIAQLAHPGVWPERSRQSVLELARRRIAIMSSDPDRREVLGGDPAIWDLCAAVQKQLHLL
jgi:hypothetical protein